MQFPSTEADARALAARLPSLPGVSLVMALEAGLVARIHVLNASHSHWRDSKAAAAELGAGHGWLVVDQSDPSDPLALEWAPGESHELCADPSEPEVFTPFAKGASPADVAGRIFEWLQEAKLGGIAFSPEGEVLLSTADPDTARLLRDGACDGGRLVIDAGMAMKMRSEIETLWQ